MGWNLMNARQTVNLAVKSMILAATMIAFSAWGLAEDINLSKTEYEATCAECHGQNGKGDGPVSVELRTKPSDLTLIAERNGGVFPADVLYRIIDGRKTIRAHGTFEMPVWGPVYLRAASEDDVRNRILAIVAYLKSLQLK
jgi:mono/diheme cytochrome c family protein